MKKNVIIGILMLAIYSVKAQSSSQEDTTKKTTLHTFDKVEIESAFPGGNAGWANFLSSHLVYPKKAYRKNIQGQVVAKFIVEKDGSLSNIEIASGPPELWQAVLDVLLQSPKWTPAVQNGKVVKSYKSQPINFSLQKQ
jgi:periplasmic protein TonB